MAEQAARDLMRSLCTQCAEIAERYDQIMQEENSQRRSLPCPNAFSALLTAKAKALDNAALKTAMAYNTAPISLKACQSLGGKLRDAVLAFSVASVEMDPAVFGQTFCCAVQRQAKAVLKTLVAFAETLATSPGGNNPAIPPAHGRVSDACKGIELLPKDNKSAVCERLAASTALIDDSVLELTQALAAGPGEEEMCVWSEQDRESLAPALGLLKASQHLSQKIHHCLSTKPSKCCSLEHLDAVGDSVCELSSRCDTFACALYEMDPQEILEAGCRLAGQNAAITTTARRAIKEAQQRGTGCTDVPPWMDVLEQAVQHNMGKLKEHFAS